MDKEIVIVEGVRTPFVKAWTLFNDIPAQKLGSLCVTELLQRTAIDPDRVDELIFGCVGQPSEAANVSRVIGLMAGIPKTKRAYTVSRNCASGLEAVTSAAEKINAGQTDVVIAGGTESMSNAPLQFSKDAANLSDHLCPFLCPDNPSLAILCVDEDVGVVHGRVECFGLSEIHSALLIQHKQACPVQRRIDPDRFAHPFHPMI
jgi:acetyl-CoA acetyltransferase